MLQRCLRAAAPLALALALAGRAAAEAFPPITGAERGLTAVAGQPNAPAVILFRKGELHMLDPRCSKTLPSPRISTSTVFCSTVAAESGVVAASTTPRAPSTSR